MPAGYFSWLNCFCMKEKILAAYQSRFDGIPLLVRAPGRINLIGEHTDYNQGWVLPGAIDKCLWFALGPSETNCRLAALDVQEETTFSLGDLHPAGTNWAAYVEAVVQELGGRGYAVNPFQGVFGGDIPLGSGLSSSAALCCGLISGIARLSGFTLDRPEVALVAQAAEHRIGLNCGLMDQYAVLYGRKAQLILLDCKSLDVQYFPLETGDYSLVLLNSCIKHELAAGSGYNERRQSCEAVAAHIRQQHPEVESLRDVTADLLEAARPALDPDDFRRAAYVLAENDRVHRTVAALQRNDLETVGSLLFDAHAGMRHEYEVTIPEIDLLVDLARAQSGVLGARMMGGGFGGCTINLVKTAKKNTILENIIEGYRTQTDIQPEVIDVRVSEGLQVLEA